MKNLCTSQILQKADNCFYILVDNTLHLSDCNTRFKHFFTHQTIDRGEPFLKLFPDKTQQLWQSVLQDAQHSSEALVTAIIRLDAENDSIEINWNVCAIYNKENK